MTNSSTSSTILSSLTTQKPEESGYFEPYSSFARSLRTWFIAFGIGGPVVFLGNSEAWKRLSESGQVTFITFFFFGGVVVQILMAILFKTAMWYLYMVEINKISKESCFARFSLRISECYFLEFAGDIITLCLFLIATIKTMNTIS